MVEFDMTGQGEMEWMWTPVHVLLAGYRLACGYAFKGVAPTQAEIDRELHALRQHGVSEADIRSYQTVLYQLMGPANRYEPKGNFVTVWRVQVRWSRSSTSLSAGRLH